MSSIKQFQNLTFYELDILSCAVLSLFSVHIVFYTIVLSLLLYYSKDFYNPFYLITKNLAVCDIIKLLYYIIIFYFDQLGALYVIITYVSSIVGYTNFALHVLIAINRLFGIVFFMRYKIIFTKINTIVFISGSFAFSFLMTLFLILLPLSLFLILNNVIIGIIMVMLLVTYIVILIFLFKTRNTAMLQNVSYVKEVELLVQAVFITFLLFIVVLIQTFLERGLIYSILILMLSGLYYGCPPFIYLICDKMLRGHFLNIFKKFKSIFQCQNQVGLALSPSQQTPV